MLAAMRVKMTLAALYGNYEMSCRPQLIELICRAFRFMLMQPLQFGK